MGRPRGHPDNHLLGKLGAAALHAQVADPSAHTAPARKAFGDRFVREARERFGDLPEAELHRRAEHLRKEFYTRLALKSAQARRRKRATDDDRGAAA